MDPAWIAALTALTMAVGGIVVWCLRWAWRILSRTMKFLDDYFGEPARPGVPERPGVMARLQRVEDLAREIRNETTTNGGTSMKDEIRRTASQVGTIRSKVEQLAGRVEQIDLDREHREHPAP